MALVLLIVLIVGGVSTFYSATVAAALVYGTALFWGLAVLETALLFSALDDEGDDYGGAIAAASLLIILLLFQFKSDTRPFTYLWTHKGTVAIGAIAYLVIGGVWSIAKWWFVETNAFRRVKEDFLDRHRIAGQEIPTVHKAAWAEQIVREKSNPRRSQKRFMSWIAYWPWSLAWTLVNDPLKRIARRIYNQLLSTYQRITDRVWKP
jgi:hypothetical protein